MSDDRDVDDVQVPREGTELAGLEDPDKAESYLLSWNVDRNFWGEMPTRQWSLDWVGWPTEKPRHSRRHRRWHLALTVALCASFAVCLLLVPLR